ncbi:MAG: GFA family protein [Sneathiella sp.]
MTGPFDGGCLCGDIRYHCEVEPKTVYYCHCSDCRRISGTAFYTGVGVGKDGFSVTKGTVKQWHKKADSGNGVTRSFCPTCSASIYLQLEMFPNVIFIAAGSLDDQTTLKPNLELWTTSKVDWAEIPGDIMSMEKAAG